MAQKKPRPADVDADRTKQLGLDELWVLKGKGSRRFYTVWRAEDPEPVRCPFCGGSQWKVQDRFSRTYTDCVPDGEEWFAAVLEYWFYKYRCQNPDCGRIFAREIHFASVNDNVTHRMENRIAEMVIEGKSYAAVSAFFQEAVTRQAVGQIFHRWVKNRDDRRRIRSTPETLGIFTGNTERNRYTLFLSCDGEIRILELLYGVEAASIAAFLDRLDKSRIKNVLTDWDETVYNTAEDCLPGIRHIIPVESWFEQVTSDFAEYAREQMKWNSTRNKQTLILQPPSEVYSRVSLDRLLRAKPELRSAYEAYNRLRSILTSPEERWVFAELEEWASPENLPAAFSEQMSVARMLLTTYAEAIRGHERYPECVPGPLWNRVKELEERIRVRKGLSGEALRAMVLYSLPERDENGCGASLEAVNQRLAQIAEKSGRDDNE